MWHRPRLLTAIADLLLVAAGTALLFAAVVWGAPRLRLFPLHEVAIKHELRELRQDDIEQALSPVLQGNFFTVNPEAVRLALEQLPWVRRAEVWRKWPARLEVRVEEHRPAARWEVEGAPAHNEMVNTFGEVFAANLSPAEAGRLPVLHGPVGTAPDLLKRYEEWREAFRPLGQRPVAVQL